MLVTLEAPLNLVIVITSLLVRVERKSLKALPRTLLTGNTPKRGKRKLKKALLYPIVALIAVTMTVPIVQAYVYSGYDRHRDYFLWFVIQKWELWVKIDTDADTWYLKWKKSGALPLSSGEYSLAQPYSYIKCWDDKGWEWSWGPYVIPAHPESGELTLTYRNTYTWTHTEVRWAYNAGLINLFRTLRVDFYVGS